MSTSQELGESQRFIQALQSEDELGVVVRSHILIEAKLNEFLDAVVSFPKELPSLRYYQKVELACALGLPTCHAPSLKALGDIRNAFAHNPDSGITNGIATKLRNSLSDIERRAAAVICKALANSGADIGQGDLDKLEPRALFTVVAIALRSMLTVAGQEAHKRHDTPQRRSESVLRTLSSMYPPEVM